MLAIGRFLRTAQVHGRTGRSAGIPTLTGTGTNVSRLLLYMHITVSFTRTFLVRARQGMNELMVAPWLPSGKQQDMLYDPLQCHWSFYALSDIELVLQCV